MSWTWHWDRCELSLPLSLSPSPPPSLPTVGVSSTQSSTATSALNLLHLAGNLKNAQALLSVLQKNLPPNATLASVKSLASKALATPTTRQGQANGNQYLYLDYGNFKLTNQVARNEGSIFHSHLVSGIYSWPLAPSSGIYWDAFC